ANVEESARAPELTESVARGPAKYDPRFLSCDPFGGSPSFVNYGLSAELHYLAPGERYYTVGEYFAHGTRLPVDIFFSDVNVPTRPFSSGFPSQAGPSFTRPDGQVLVEFFALRYRSKLQLGPNDLPGKYQIALLSDDGSILSADLDGDGSPSPFLNNDGDHPSKLACATRTVRFDNSTRLPIQLDYYQGPKFHIANIILWRHIPESQDEEANPSILSDAQCGNSGNALFFDSTQTPPTPQTAWIDLLSRGWKVLERENYLLSEEHPQNPCCPGCDIGA
ncbi:MAG TPA: hypothetical protein VM598_07920, partial [Bdellovibrionota bacterium]|nr:hypothetical protein [Bdellovibrionota bacterium]